MSTRLVGGAMALGVAVGLVGAAVLAASGWGDDEPRRLAVLGQTGGAGTEAAMSADSSAFGGTTYRLAPGVGHAGGEATAWSVRTGEAVEERIRGLAAALGLSGDVVSEELAWSVTDGGRRLEVQRQPGLPWSFLPTGGGVAGSPGSASSDAAVSSDPVPAEEQGAATGKGDTTIACAMPECPPGTVCAAVCPEVDPFDCDDPATQCLAPDGQPEPVRPADLPTAGEAEVRGREVLTAAGLDLEGAVVRVDDGFTSWYVSADPSVGGLPTVGMSWGVAVGAGGAIESANGWLTEPERGDTYPLLPVATVVERLAGMSTTLELRVECPADEACPEAEPVVLTVTGTRLGLQLVSSFEAEEAFLVPSYLFEIDGAGPASEIPAFAVADEYLTSPPAPEPVPLPEPLPGETPPGAEEPPNVGPAQPPLTEQPAPRDGLCNVATGPAGQAVPLEVEVCAVNGTAGGEPVVLTVTATDPDARVRNDCGSPVVSWGDGEPTAICDIGVACAADEAATPLETSLEHIYARPGTYEVTVTAEAVCDDPASGSLTVSVLAVVNP